MLMGLTACAPPRRIAGDNWGEELYRAGDSWGSWSRRKLRLLYAAEGKPQRVERRFYLAGSYLCQQALVSGRIDGYVEYTGTALTAILKQPLPETRSREAVLAEIRPLYESRVPCDGGAWAGI